MKLLAALLVASALWAQTPASRDVEVYGQKIHYLETGSGPAVILLHGLGGDASHWAQTTPALAKSFHVFVPDQIGFGESAKPQIEYRIGTLVDFLNGFCKKLNINKATVVGNSLGGWTAIAFTLAHPERVDRMVLVDAAGYSLKRTGQPVSPELLRGLNPSTLESTRALMLTVFANKAMVTDAFVEQVFIERMRRGDSYTIDRFMDSYALNLDVIDGKLDSIKVPTLVVWGREDALTPLAGGQSMAKEIAGAELAILDKCGHSPQMECAAPFNSALLKFLNSAPGPTASKQ